MSVSENQLINTLEALLEFVQRVASSNTRSKKDMIYFLDPNDHLGQKPCSVFDLQEAIAQVEIAVENVEQHSPRHKRKSSGEYSQGLDEFAQKFTRAYSLYKSLRAQLPDTDVSKNLQTIEKKLEKIFRVLPKMMRRRDILGRQRLRSTVSGKQKDSKRPSLLARFKELLNSLLQSLKAWLHDLREPKYQKLDDSRVVVETPAVPTPRKVPSLNFAGIEQSDAQFTQEKLLGSPAPMRKHGGGKPRPTAQTVDPRPSRTGLIVG